MFLFFVNFCQFFLLVGREKERIEESEGIKIGHLLFVFLWLSRRFLRASVVVFWFQFCPAPFPFFAGLAEGSHTFVRVLLISTGVTFAVVL